MMDLHLSSLGTLVPEVPQYVFYAKRHQFYIKFDINDTIFASTLV